MNDKVFRARFLVPICIAVVTTALTSIVVAQSEVPLDFAALATPSVTVTGVAPNHSSARVFYNPVAGAKDYRVYDVAAPTNVKYAGQVHLIASPACPDNGSSCVSRFQMNADGTPVFPYRIVPANLGGAMVLDVPATDIEWNGLGDGHPHTLVVEAVDALGPVPKANLYSSPNFGADTPLAPGGMLGSNKGPTDDGNTSTNGQGPYTNNPHVIARSSSFVVTPNTSYAAIPSSSAAAPVFYDSFENSEAGTVHLINRSETADSFGNVGLMSYGMNTGTPKEWTLVYRQADDTNSMPFISNDHFMDMLFDGATPPPAGGGPSHTLYSSMAMTPNPTVDISNGKVLHMTMEVDGHQSLGRWLAFNLAPASDPLQGFQPINAGINNTDQGLFLELRDGFCTLGIFTGPSAGAGSKPTGTAGASVNRGGELWGLDGASGANCNLPAMYDPSEFSKNALGLDDRSRYDFFLSATHVAMFQDGRMVAQSDIPAGSFPWANQPMRAYFTHYLYHSDSERGFMLTRSAGSYGNFNGMCFPLNSYWFNDALNGIAAADNTCGIAYPAGYGFRFSDERHWDNMGMETLASPGNNYAAFGPLVQLAQPQPPQFSATPVATNTAVPTSTAVPTNTAVPTTTSVPTDTPTAVATATNTPLATATPAATAVPVTCRVSVEINGTPGPYNPC